MNRALVLALSSLVPLVAAAQDQASIGRLEQEVRQLQREVLTLSQLVSELRARVERQATPLPPAPAAPRVPSTPGGTGPAAGASASSARWIDAARWQSLRTGMSELEIVEMLGPPTSMRVQDNERVLFYALEIGNSGFLAGSVTLRDRAAVSIELPRLK